MESRVAGDMNKTIFNQHSKSSNEKKTWFLLTEICAKRHWKDGSDWGNYPTIAALLVNYYNLSIYGINL